MKLKDSATLHQWKNYYNQKVWTVNASDVEWIELEHYSNSENIKSIEEEIQFDEDCLINKTLSHKDN